MRLRPASVQSAGSCRTFRQPPGVLAAMLEGRTMHTNLPSTPPPVCRPGQGQEAGPAPAPRPGARHVRRLLLILPLRPLRRVPGRP